MSWLCAGSECPDTDHPWRRPSSGFSIARSPVFPIFGNTLRKCAVAPGGFRPSIAFIRTSTTPALFSPLSTDFEGAQGRRAKEAFARGVEWVFTMQNRDGGFSAFDVNSSKQLLERLPFNDMRRAMIDPSSADMTGRTLAFISGLCDCRAARASRRALAWLDTHQGNKWIVVGALGDQLYLRNLGGASRLWCGRGERR